MSTSKTRDSAGCLLLILIRRPWSCMTAIRGRSNPLLANAIGGVCLMVSNAQRAEPRQVLDELAAWAEIECRYANPPGEALFSDASAKPELPVLSRSRWLSC